MEKDMKRSIFAALLGVLTALCVIGMGTWMILEELLDVAHMDLLSAGVLITASGAAALFCGGGERRIKRIVISETVFVLMLGIFNLALFDGNLSGFIPCLLLIIGTSGGVILVTSGNRKKTYGKYGRKKRTIGNLNKKYSR